MFNFLNKLRHAATGTDQIPAWFLKVGAHVFTGLAFLVNMSLNSSVVPINGVMTTSSQGLSAKDTERLPANFKHVSAIQDNWTNCCARLHISITRVSTASPGLHQSILDRVIYHGGDHSSSTQHHHHVAKQPVRYCHRSWNMRHLSCQTIFKIGFQHRSPSTTFQGQSSNRKEVTASTVQGSSIGPDSFVVTASDHHPLTSKCHDVMYLIVPASNVKSYQLEVDHTEEWTKENNLVLNRSKSAELVIRYFKGYPAPSIDVINVGLSDHRLLQWHVDFSSLHIGHSSLMAATWSRSLSCPFAVIATLQPWRVAIVQRWQSGEAVRRSVYQRAWTTHTEPDWVVYAMLLSWLTLTSCAH